MLYASLRVVTYVLHLTDNLLCFIPCRLLLMYCILRIIFYALHLAGCCLMYCVLLIVFHALQLILYTLHFTTCFHALHLVTYPLCFTPYSSSFIPCILHPSVIEPQLLSPVGIVHRIAVIDKVSVGKRLFYLPVESTAFQGTPAAFTQNLVRGDFPGRVLSLIHI